MAKCPSNVISGLAYGRQSGQNCGGTHLSTQTVSVVDELGTHGLSSCNIRGGHSRHAALNDIIKRSLEESQQDSIHAALNDIIKHDSIEKVRWCFCRPLALWENITVGFYLH